MATEFRLLTHFLQHRGAVISRDELLADVWGYGTMPVTFTTTGLIDASFEITLLQ